MPATTKHKANVGKAGHQRNNGRIKTKHSFVHVVTPASASQIRKTLRISKHQVQNVLRAFKAAGLSA